MRRSVGWYLSQFLVFLIGGLLWLLIYRLLT